MDERERNIAQRRVGRRPVEGHRSGRRSINTDDNAPMRCAGRHSAPSLTVFIADRWCGHRRRSQQIWTPLSSCGCRLLPRAKRPGGWWPVVTNPRETRMPLRSIDKPSSVRSWSVNPEEWILAFGRAAKLGHQRGGSPIVQQ